MVEVVRLTRREQQERTRLRILDAALGVFRRTGFAKATIDEIAELAGCTRGTVYLHFGGKEGLMVSVAEHHSDAQLTAFRAEVDTATCEAELLTVLLRSAAPAPERRSTVVLDWATMVSGLPSGDDLALRVVALQNQVDEAYGHLIARICELRGVTPALPPRRLAVLLLALTEGLLVRGAVNTDVDVHAGVRSSFELLLTGGSR